MTVQALRDAWRRRRRLGLFITILVTAGAASLVLSLPDMFRSSVKVLIERGEVPEGIVGRSDSTDPDLRLRMISQRVLTRSRLQDLMEKFDLYARARAERPEEAVAEYMRRRIDLEIEESPRSWGRDSTIAFTLSFHGLDRHKVARVANALAELYLQENMRERDQRTTSTSRILHRELNDLEKRLNDQEARINEFKRLHMGELPGQVEMNMRMVERLNEQLQLNNERRLQALDHQRDIKSGVGREGGTPPGEADPPAIRLARLHTQLEKLQARYTPHHPDILRTRREIEVLEQKLGRASGDGVAADPLTRLQQEIDDLKAEERTLEALAAAHQEKVENAPRLELELQELTRDYDATKEAYHSLLQRYDEARLGWQLEDQQLAGHFHVIEPAVPAALPVAPDRPKLLMAGMMMALLLGLGGIVLAEKLDASFHGVGALREFTSVPVLATIPPIVSTGDRWRNRFLGAVRLTLAAVCVAVAAAALHLVARESEDLVTLLSRNMS